MWGRYFARGAKWVARALWEHDAAGSEPKANGRAVVNDMPVAYQSREVTEPQRDSDPVTPTNYNQTIIK